MRKQTALLTALACAAFVGAPAAAEDEVSPELRTEVTELYGALLDFEYECGEECAEGCGMECMQRYAMRDPARKMVELLVRSYEGWTVAGPLMRDGFTSKKTTPEQRTRILTVLAQTPADPARELSTELFAKSPKSFSEDHVIVFAQAVGEDFLRDLQRRVKRGDTESILPAALLAMEGDDVGRKSLVQALEAGPTGEDTASYLVAACALASLQEDETVLEQAQVRVHDAVMALLDAGDLAGARTMALQAEFVHRTAGGYGKGIEMAFLGERAAGHCAERGPMVADADAVFSLIEGITPL